jgi:hypothetical protein
LWAGRNMRLRLPLPWGGQLRWASVGTVHVLFRRNVGHEREPRRGIGGARLQRRLPLRPGPIDATDNSSDGGAGLREPDLGRECAESRSAFFISTMALAAALGYGGRDSGTSASTNGSGSGTLAAAPARPAFREGMQAGKRGPRGPAQPVEAARVRAAAPPWTLRRKPLLPSPAHRRSSMRERPRRTTWKFPSITGPRPRAARRNAAPDHRPKGPGQGEHEPAKRVPDPVRYPNPPCPAQSSRRARSAGRGPVLLEERMLLEKRMDARAQVRPLLAYRVRGDAFRRELADL